MARQRAVHLDAQQPARFGAGERHLRLFDVRQNAQTALIVGFAVQRRADVAGGALQQPDLQPGFELFDGVGHGGARQVQILRRLGKAALFYHAGEQAHGVDSVHNCSFISDSDNEE